MRLNILKCRVVLFYVLASVAHIDILMQYFPFQKILFLEDESLHCSSLSCHKVVVNS